ncbi:helix-turn-helix domain-containing protein [Streptomyces sp. LE64]|uniref:helix-turn-helix domain-containing protein n=1 Tax=Streptomyces sp. LE64 TaxID=3448653 RepID=UPI00404285A7
MSTTLPGPPERTGYAERPARVPGAALWSSGPSPGGGTVLPDGCMDLMWSAGRLWVAGPDTRPHRPDRTAPYAGVRFAPGTAHPVLGVPARALRDQRVELADLWPARTVRALADRIAAAPDPVAALDAVALGLRAAGGPDDPRVARIVAGLRAGRSVGAVADEVGLGARALHRRSLEVFGYGPKTLARVLRFQRALALVRAGTARTDAALAAGYADQAHLARETRALAGTTLGRLVPGPAPDGQASGANRSTPLPSGSATSAYR